MLGELFTSAAEAQPDEPAVIVSSRSVSYRKLDAQAHALARALQRRRLMRERMSAAAAALTR